VWPQLNNAHLFVLVTSLIFSLQMFDQIYVMTQGGPITSTYVLVYDIYLNTFDSMRLGYASAESVFLILIIGTATLVGIKLTRSLDES